MGFELSQLPGGRANDSPRPWVCPSCGMHTTGQPTWCNNHFQTANGGRRYHVVKKVRLVRAQQAPAQPDELEP